MSESKNVDAAPSRGLADVLETLDGLDSKGGGPPDNQLPTEGEGDKHHHDADAPPPLQPDPGNNRPTTDRRRPPTWLWILLALLLLVLLGLGLWAFLGGGDHSTVNPLVRDPASGTPRTGEPSPVGTEVVTPEAWRAFYTAVELKVGNQVGIIYFTGEKKLYVSLSTVLDIGAPPEDRYPGGYFDEHAPWTNPDGTWKPFPSAGDLRRHVGFSGDKPVRWIKKDPKGALVATPWPDGSGDVYGIIDK